jgi:hypothetical protein
MFFMIDVINNYMKNMVKNMMFPTGSRSESYEFLATCKQKTLCYKHHVLTWLQTKNIMF